MSGSEFSLPLPEQVIASLHTANYFLCILPNIPQTGVFATQIQVFLFATHPFDHIFAHRQRKTAPPEFSLRRGGLFLLMQSCSIAFLLESPSWYALVVYSLLLAAAPPLRCLHRFSPPLANDGNKLCSFRSPSFVDLLASCGRSMVRSDSHDS